MAKKVEPEQIKHWNNKINSITLKNPAQNLLSQDSHSMLSCSLFSNQPQHPNTSTSRLITRPAEDQQIKVEEATLPKAGLLQTPLLAILAISPHQPHCHISHLFQTTVSFDLGVQKIKLTSPVPEATFSISPTWSLLKRSNIKVAPGLCPSMERRAHTSSKPPKHQRPQDFSPPQDKPSPL